ncbi:VOC family protein [Amycolatopsis sp. BJA-103]|uniref:VOC family protein n=1 Tax=Amycolatopsis sp. BJA-103 TaxID=1911175 RepID=UPI000C783B6C|nr:VOC family protein [Amycolatopsis sp. BJA-103]AUI60379.1 VOC family virulence protein [Amycolatopsis sp. BJA-103]PNE16404.1 VOC family virulence protein [Amycolatopsis sp. BJA-103]
MHYERLDHTVLTVNDLDATVDFYGRLLGMEVITFDSLVENRKALRFGNSKINLHEAGNEIQPTAANPGPGTEHLCMIVKDPVEVVADHLRAAGVAIEDGPVERAGALGPINSVYVRDPDGNLIELSNPVEF